MENTTKLYVGGLPYSTTEAELQDYFAQAGAVTEAVIIRDKMMNNRSKGFGFVEMASDSEATDAVTKLNGSELDGRKIVVSEARPKA
jgi:RNA recognition motif-containing protein